jgi:acyl-CoA thioester hydrolase
MHGQNSRGRIVATGDAQNPAAQICNLRCAGWNLDFEAATVRLNLRAMIAPVFRHTHRVTYAECTLGNHIYYARYLDLLEAARNEFFRDLGVTFLQWQERDTIFPVVECRLRYQLPARYDEVLSIEVWLTAGTRARLNFAYRVLNEAGQLILEAETFHVCTGLNEKPKRLPDDLADRLKPYLRAEVPGAPLPKTAPPAP